jgi:hypothetical protein
MAGHPIVNSAFLVDQSVLKNSYTLELILGQVENTDQNICRSNGMRGGSFDAHHNGMVVLGGQLRHRRLQINVMDTPLAVFSRIGHAVLDWKDASRWRSTLTC